MDILKILSIAAPLSVLVGCRYINNPLLWLYAATGFICDLMSCWTWSYKVPQNIFLLAEFVLLSWFFGRFLFRTRRQFVLLFISLHAIVYLILLCSSSPGSPQIEVAALFSFYYMIYSIATMLVLVRRKGVFTAEDNLLFGTSAVIYVYAAGAFLLFLFAPVLYKNDRELFVKLWGTFFASLNIFRYLSLSFVIRKTAVNA